MKLRSIAATGFVVLSIALPASAAPAQEPPLPAAPGGDAGMSRGLGASLPARGLDAFVWAYQQNDVQPEACVQLSDASSGRFEFGCGPVEFAMDPALRSASVRGTIPSYVYEDRGGGRESTLSVDLSLEGTGVYQTGIGQGSWISPPWVEAGAGASVWRPARGSGRVDSTGFCSTTRNTRPRRPRGRRGATCTPGTGTSVVEDAGLGSDLGAWIGSGDDGECGKGVMSSGC